MRVIKVVSLVLLGAFIIAAPPAWASWVANGVALCTAAGERAYPTIASDGSGGAIVTWEDWRSGNGGIYAQRTNASGNVLWTTNGVALCTALGGLYYPTIVSDGWSGAIVTWMDYRSGGADIYAQKVSAAGAVQWTTDGVAICAATGDQNPATVVSDGAGGAIVTWMDYRSGGAADIYAQRVDASGAIRWTADGVAICTATGTQGMGNQGYPTTVSDGAGGAIITWYDYRSGSNADIYAQRVNASGAVQWTTDGVAVCTAVGDQGYPAIASDGAGGAVVTWEDWRNGNGDVYAQRVNASGAAQWATDGVALCTAAGIQYYPTITSDGSGGAIATWTDYGSGGNEDIYAQRVNASGAVQWAIDGVALCTGTGGANPQIIADGGGGAIVTWPDVRGAGGDIYAQKVNASGAAEWAANGVAVCAAEGNQGSPTITSDGSGGAIVTWNDYRSGSWDVFAQKVDATGSAPPSGQKPPKTPQGLIARAIYDNGNVIALLIAWNRNKESNISHYEVYKGATAYFIPGSGNLLASPRDTFLYDVQWTWDSHSYYRVAAVDSNRLRSGFGLIRSDDVTGTDTPQAPEASYLAQNYPNPFNPATRIEFGLRESVRVSLRIYDAAGRLVRVVSGEQLSPGRYARIWDGKDANGSGVASGVYFYRLDAGSFTETKKMVLLR